MRWWVIFDIFLRRDVIGVRVWNDRRGITMTYNTSIESSGNALS